MSKNRYLCIFYQIYDELNSIRGICATMNEAWMEQLTLIMKNKKREERLHQRVSALEDQNEELVKEIKRMQLKHEETAREVELYNEHDLELCYKHNAMVATINMMITELNNIMSFLSNKDEKKLICFTCPL